MDLHAQCRACSNIGLGDQFDGDKVKVFPPGCSAGNTSHFHWAKSGEYITQVTAIRPIDLEYLGRRRSALERHSPAS
jgi:hypothetical protein